MNKREKRDITRAMILEDNNLYVGLAYAEQIIDEIMDGQSFLTSKQIYEAVARGVYAGIYRAQRKERDLQFELVTAVRKDLENPENFWPLLEAERTIKAAAFVGKTGREFENYIAYAMYMHGLNKGRKEAQRDTD